MLSHQENILEAPWQELVRHRMAGRNPCYPCLRRSQHMVLDGILWGAHLCSGRQANWDCPHSGSWSPPDAPPARVVKSACCRRQRSWTGGPHAAGAGKRLSPLEVDVWGGGCGCPFLGCRRREIQGGPPCWPRERRCLLPSGKLGRRARARGGPASCTGSRVPASC